MAELGPNAEPVDDPAGELLRQLYEGDRHCECLTEDGLTVHCSCAVFQFHPEFKKWVPERNIWVMAKIGGMPMQVIAMLNRFDEDRFRDAVGNCLNEARSKFVLDVLSRQ